MAEDRQINVTAIHWARAQRFDGFVDRQGHPLSRRYVGRVILIGLALLVDADGVAEIGVEGLAALCQCSTRRVARWMWAFEAKGLIARHSDCVTLLFDGGAA